MTTPHPPRIALCISGGGFRATIFHLGALRRLNELGVLSQVEIVSSVSGGSILNGLLATLWPQFTAGPGGVFTNLDGVLGNRVRRFCSADLRTRLLLGERLNPLRWVDLTRNRGAISGNSLAGAYQGLFGAADLDSVPPHRLGFCPRFVFCATNVRTGACWHFHAGPNGRMGDFYTGYTSTAGVSVAEAVAASSAFPPGFAALSLPTAGKTLTREDPWGAFQPLSKKRAPLRPEALTNVLLTDGGVYDNLGVEPIWNRPNALLVSDAGRPFFSREHCPQNVVSRLGRAADISMAQVGAVRKRWLVDSFKSGARRGALWAIDTPIEDYGLPSPQGYGPSVRSLLAGVRTDLNSFTRGEMDCLENHGYSLAAAAMKSLGASLCTIPSPPFDWPNAASAQDEDVSRSLENSGARHYARDAWNFLVGKTSRRGE